MCPVCLTAAVIGAGVSGGGIAAAIRKKGAALLSNRGPAIRLSGRRYPLCRPDKHLDAPTQPQETA